MVPFLCKRRPINSLAPPHQEEENHAPPAEASAPNPRRTSASSHVSRAHATHRAQARSQGAHDESDGARQSPRGLNDPPSPTFGAFGTHVRLNCDVKKNRLKNVRWCFRISTKPNARSSRMDDDGAASRKACIARKALLAGRSLAASFDIIENRAGRRAPASPRSTGSRRPV